jgi:HK97 family phage major capsid protein
MELQELRDERKRLAEQANDVLTSARADGRMDLRADETAKFDAIHVDIDKLQERIAREEKQDALNKAIEEPQGRRSQAQLTNNDANRGNGNGNRTGKVTDQDRTEGLRAWALAGRPDEPISDRQRDCARRSGIDLNSKSITLSFGPALKSISEEGIRNWNQEMAEQRAALTGAQSTTTTGGYTVADEMMRTLEVALLAFGGVRSVATVLRTATGGPLPIPTTNDTSNKGALVAENTTQTELEMTFSQLVLDAYKYTSKYILASVEFLQDSSINVNEFLGLALANRIGRITNDDFSTGNGSAKPNGIVPAAASGVTGVADPPTHDNLQDLIHSIDPAYRGNARFMFNDTTLKSLKKIKVLQYSGDTTGIPLWQPSMQLGQADRILGYEFTINQSMASPGSSAKKILFGDLSKYIVRDVRDFTLLRLDERFAELQQVAFLAFSRHDGDLLDAGTNPVKYMSQA